MSKIITFDPMLIELLESLQMAHSFFKILLDPSAPYMSLPSDFVSMHLENKITSDPIIRSAYGRFSWRLKIKNIGGGYCFTDGWKNVVEDMRLGFADFLFFQLVDQSTFKISVYSPDGCEKLLPPKIEHHEDVACEFVNVVDEDEVKKKVDDDDDEDYDYDVNNDDDDDDDYDDGDGDDDDYDGNIDDDDDLRIEESGDDDVRIEENDGDDVQIEENDGDDVQIEENGDDDEDEDEDEDDDDPSFRAIMNRTHTKLLRFPAGFEKLAGINSEGPMMLKNRDGKEWVTGLKLDKSYRASIRYYVSFGWWKFRRENGLSEGDECVFKFIRSERKLLLAKVTKSKSKMNSW